MKRKKRLLPDEKLSCRTKLVYGIGELGNSIPYTIISFFYLIYLTDIVKIKPGVAGSILLIGKLWDAVADPFIGHKSDQMNTKWGRRRPFFLFFRSRLHSSFF
jgi:Na+/melibiose symporter-like transporter